MLYVVTINQVTARKHDLSVKEMALLDLFSKLSSWAEDACFDDGVYYYIAYSVILKQLPIFFTTQNTVYRHLFCLKQKQFIQQRKKGITLKNYIRLTPKAKAILGFGKNAEASQGSQKKSTRFAKNAEAQKSSLNNDNQLIIKRGSQKKSTYYNKDINDNIYIEPSSNKSSGYSFLKEVNPGGMETWEMNNKSEIESFTNYNDFIEFFNIKVEEEQIVYDQKVLFARLKRLKFYWVRNRVNGRASDQESYQKAKIIE